jgi:hypothetical protein
VGGGTDAAARHRRGEQRVELREPLLEADELRAPVDEEILAELVPPVHLEDEAAEVAQPALAELQERAPLAAELSCGRQRAANRAGSRRRRLLGRLAVGGASETRQARHQPQCNEPNRSALTAE